MSIFKNKVFVVTGAGSGIGRSLAQQLAAKGAKLALSDINASALDETLKTLSGTTKIEGYTLDVADRQAMFAHADQVVADFGAVHGVFNNAGVTVVGTVNNLSIEEIEWQLSINLWGVIYGTKAFLPFFLKQNEGWIVNLSSVFGLVSFPAQSAYNMSKFAVRGLTECLWAELEGTGVHAVSVHPGGIKTKIESDSRLCAAAGKVEAEFSEKAAKLLKTPPEVCAADILRGMEQGKRRVITGHKSTSLYWLSRLLPNHYPAVMKRLAG